MNTEKIEKYKLVIERLIKGNQVNRSAPDNYVKNDVGIFLDNMLERINDGMLFNMMEVETPLCSIKLRTGKWDYDIIHMRLECKFVSDSNDEVRGTYTLMSHSSDNETIEVDYKEDETHDFKEYSKIIATLEDIKNIVEGTDFSKFFKDTNAETAIKNKNIINSLIRFMLESSENGVPIWFMETKLVDGKMSILINSFDVPYTHTSLTLNLNDKKYILTSTPVKED